ncbi:tRNA A22 N-methylase [Bradyrhizobium japonicum]
MEAASTRKDVIKRFWNIGCDHSAIALQLVRMPVASRDDAPPVGSGTSSQSHDAADARHLRAKAAPNPGLTLVGE